MLMGKHGGITCVMFAIFYSSLVDKNVPSSTAKLLNWGAMAQEFGKAQIVGFFFFFFRFWEIKARRSGLIA